MSTSDTTLYCLRVHAEDLPGLRYVFKCPPSAVRAVDPDLGIPYDLAFDPDSDAVELVRRLLTKEEADLARDEVVAALAQTVRGPKPTVELVAVDPREPLEAFDQESRLLRLLAFSANDILSDEVIESLSRFSFAWASSRADGIRRTSDKLLYRRGEQQPQLCFEVSARRTTPGEEATVVARYGNGMRNIEPPRERLERFGLLEWGYPVYNWETDGLLVCASRALSEAQARTIADRLRDARHDTFENIEVSAQTLGHFRADEGLMGGSHVFSAQGTEEEERRVGFPYFLSVWRDDDCDCD